VSSPRDILKIQTPEFVGFQYSLAGLGSRATAYLFDVLFRGLLVLIAFVLVAVSSKLLPELDPTGFLANLSKTWLLALAVLAYGIADLGYFMAFEAMWNGQTPGKRLQGIRVIRANGEPVGWIESAIRNILRAVDLIGGVYPLGILFMFLSARSQRIGDYAAGTVVVVEHKQRIPLLNLAGGQREMPRVHDLEMHLHNLGSEEYRLVRSFLQRREGMDRAHRSQLARTLAQRLMSRWGMAPRPEISYESFLEEVIGAYERSRRAL
jgi:uncharacterized RDD family membrane protein YckC